MESRIPLPTDNIFKFYAFFGLLLIIFGIGSTLYVNQSTNSLVFDIAVEYETLKIDPVRSGSDETRFLILDRKLEIAKKNKTFFLICLSIIIGLGFLLVWYGFKKWHTEIQPLQDEIARLSLKKLQQEVDEHERKLKELKGS
ncbi:MAG: hypothetical protein COA96_01535 [SAR86 cluster bacterium]|uniref:Uncharacterized protein n=1 Tax=SAR86 cluster bacterium TaxID=2030880 RepID=A0A2A5BB23_9GAMM|nr:MAG: hypothetical protein COA96_01535 [SAR86 cluster bacterium]